MGEGRRQGGVRGAVWAQTKQAWDRMVREMGAGSEGEIDRIVKCVCVGGGGEG